MKNRKVRQIRVHIGIHLNMQVLSSVNAEKHGVEMELWPMGIYIKSPKEEKMIPFGNIHDVDFYVEEKK